MYKSFEPESASGHVASCTLSDIICDSDSVHRNSIPSSSQRIHGKILHLSLSRVLRTGQQIIFAGGDDGSIAIFDYK